MSDFEDRMRDILRAAPGLMRVLAVARDLDLPDWLVFSGAIYQPVWNHLTDRPADYGVNDYDLAYFDPADLSWDAEDRVIRRVAAAFEPPLRAMVEAGNQARVHLWFEAKFGEPYAPLSQSAEALTRFTSPTFAVGARLGRDDRLTIVAPFGLADLFGLRIRPNPLRPSAGLARTIDNARRRWPEVVAERL